jgi:hypothetical protein
MPTQGSASLLSGSRACVCVCVCLRGVKAFCASVYECVCAYMSGNVHVHVISNASIYEPDLAQPYKSLTTYKDRV